MKKILFGAACLFLEMTAVGQTIGPRAVPAAGGYAAGANGATLSYTVGETCTPTLGGGGYLLSQGQQQPEIDLRVTAVGGGLCPGQTLTVAFGAAGYVSAANQFGLQLSDAGGSFAAPLVLGTLAGIQSGTFAVTVPNGTYAGTGYRIRVVGSHPVFSSPATAVSASGCTLSFGGTIRWEQDGVSGVNNATVSLSGAGSGNDLSDSNGDYLISIPAASGNFSVKPVKNINRLNGVTAADVIAIQQHLVNVNPITNPYKLVAADINRSNSVTSADANLLNQCLLGNPAANSAFSVFWRFVPQSYSLSMPPWGFPEQINLTGVSSNQSGLDFKGVKIGDVVSTWANPANLVAPGPLAWQLEDRPLSAGQTLALEFSAGAFPDLAAWQFALAFDPERLRFDQVEPLPAWRLTADNFGLSSAETGELRSVWAQPEGRDLPAGAAVFRLRFSVLQTGGWLSEALSLDESALPALAYNSALAESPVCLKFVRTTSAGDPAGAPGLQLFQNQPNPFSGPTAIGFVLPEGCAARLRIIDESGRIRSARTKTYPAGRHVEMFDLGDATGVFWYELTTPFGTLTKKMTGVRE